MRKSILALIVAIFFILNLSGCGMLKAKKQKRWAPHDMSRPLPPVVIPAEQIGQPPSDAIVLFDGKDLEMWTWGEKADWKVENGYIEVGGKGDIKTKKGFGDCQLHLEWMSPAEVNEGQHRGNSGVFMMDRYEIQILDSWKNITYADGMVGAIYGQVPPLVNACKKPGEWQSYDIIFHAPKFNKSGKVIKKARATIFLNGILVQDNSEFQGSTVHKKYAVYKAHAEKEPIMLQNHKCKVRFRNIWIRELVEQ